jgi:hypothetical protein
MVFRRPHCLFSIRKAHAAEPDASWGSQWIGATDSLGHRTVEQALVPIKPKG